MRQLIRFLQGERRRDEREPARRMVQVFAAGSNLGVARLFDEGDGGARISLVEGRQPPSRLMLVEIETATAHVAEIRWRSEDQVGVRFLRSQRLRGFVEPEFADAKAFWEDAAVVTE